MCQAAFDNGPAVNQKGMFALAEARFTSALTAAPAGADSIKNAALVGRARVRLYQGNTAGALVMPEVSLARSGGAGSGTA